MAPGKVQGRKSARAWDGLSPPLEDWILEAVSAMGFKQMTPVQAATIPHFLGNKDVVVEVRKNSRSLLDSFPTAF